MRPVLIVIATAIILGIAYHAFAATSPYREHPSVSPHSLKEARETSPGCVTAKIIVLALRLPDGRLIAARTFVVFVPCN